MSFVPPTYGKFGKNYKDLTKKKYDFSHTFKTINKASNGVTFESGALNTKSGLQGYLKSKLVTSKYEVEGEASTSATAETKATARFPRLSPGVNVSTTLSSADPAFKGLGVTAELEYATRNFATVHEVKTNGQRHFLKSSATVGAEGFTFGGQLALDLSNGADVTDYNVGVEYAQPTYTATLLTEKKADVATLSYFHKLNPSQTVGAGVRVELSGQRNATLTVAEEIALNPTTTFKAKAEIPSRIVSTVIEHRLTNPQLAINVAASFNPTSLVSGGPLKAEEYGLGLSFGDY